MPHPRLTPAAERGPSATFRRGAVAGRPPGTGTSPLVARVVLRLAGVPDKLGPCSPASWWTRAEYELGKEIRRRDRDHRAAGRRPHRAGRHPAGDAALLHRLRD